MNSRSTSSIASTTGSGSGAPLRFVAGFAALFFAVAFFAVPFAVAFFAAPAFEVFEVPFLTTRVAFFGESEIGRAHV